MKTMDMVKREQILQVRKAAAMVKEIFVLAQQEKATFECDIIGGEAYMKAVANASTFVINLPEADTLGDFLRTLVALKQYDESNGTLFVLLRRRYKNLTSVYPYLADRFTTFDSVWNRVKEYQEYEANLAKFKKGTKLFYKFVEEFWQEEALEGQMAWAEKLAEQARALWESNLAEDEVEVAQWVSTGWRLASDPEAIKGIRTY